MALVQSNEYESNTSGSQQTSTADSLHNLPSGGESLLDDDFEYDKSLTQCEDEGDRELSWLTALQRPAELEQDATSVCSCIDEDASDKLAKAHNTTSGTCVTHEQRISTGNEDAGVRETPKDISISDSNGGFERCVHDGKEISVSEICDASVFQTLTKRQSTALLKRVATLNATIRKRTAQRAGIAIPNSQSEVVSLGNTQDPRSIIQAKAAALVLKNVSDSPAVNQPETVPGTSPAGEDTGLAQSNKQLIADLTEPAHHHNLAERFGRILLPHGKYTVAPNDQREVEKERDDLDRTRTRDRDAASKKGGSLNHSVDESEAESLFESDFAALPNAVDEHGAQIFGIALHVRGGLTLIDDLVRTDAIRFGSVDSEPSESKRSGQASGANSKSHKPGKSSAPAYSYCSADLVELRRLALLDATASFDQFSIDCFVSLPPASAHAPSPATSGHSAFTALFQKRSSSSNQKVLFGSSLNASNVAFCEYLVAWLREGNRLDSVGLFRVSASSARVRVLTEELEREAANGCFASSNSSQTANAGGVWLFEFAERRELTAHEAGTLLKRFIRAVPHSVFTRELHDAFAACGALPERDAVRIGTLNELFLLLPAANRRVLNAILCLLHDTARRADRNRMTINNLALVLAPTLFALAPVAVVAADATGSSERDSNTSIVVAALIQYHSALSVVPSHLLEQLRRVNELKRERLSKNALARCRLDRVSKRAESANLSKTGPASSTAQIRVLFNNTSCIAQVTPQTTVIDLLAQLSSNAASLPSRRDMINDDLVESSDAAPCCRHVLSTGITTDLPTNNSSRRASNQSAQPAHFCAHALTRASSALFTPLSMSIAKPNTVSAKRQLWLFEVGGSLVDSRRLDPEASVLEVFADNPTAEWMVC